MLSQITWAQFWLFITAAIPAYYFVIALVYFRTETTSFLNGKFLTKTQPAQKQGHLSNVTQVIGSLEDEPTDYPYRFRSQSEDKGYDEPTQSGSANLEKLYSDDDEIYIPDDLSGKINNALLNDAVLDEDFLAKVNKELEEEQLLQTQGEIPVDIALEEEPWIDAEDFFKLLEQGIDSLEEEKRSQILQSSLYKELFEDSHTVSTDQPMESGSGKAEEHSAEDKINEVDDESATY